MNKKLIGLVLGSVGALTLAGCSITDNQTSTISTPKPVATNEAESPSQVITQTQTEAKVEVVSHKEKKSTYGASSIVGEVVNNGTASASFVKVTITFYDEKGDVVDTSFTFAGDTASVELKPGAKTPFEIHRMENIKFSSYKLDVSWND